MKRLTMLVMPLMAISLLASCNQGGGDTPEPEFNRWYTYSDWWNYCSSDNPTSEATSDDVGKEVDVIIYEKVHKVRLIDVDHIDTKGEEPEAHCTFEFENVITDSNGEAVTIQWDEINNYNFPDSAFNKLLNKNSNCIFNQLPSGLQEAIKEVSKKVGMTSSYSATSYSTKLFPLAHDEMTNHDICVANDEGTIYQYYMDHPEKADRIKTTIDRKETKYYWVRSPSISDDNLAWCVGTDGGFHSTQGAKINSSYAIAPAFCI